MSISEPNKYTTLWAQNGIRFDIPPAADPVTGKAGFDVGFSSINMASEAAGGIPPWGQDFNGILFSITEVLRYMQAGGRPTFSAAMATAIGGYPKGAVVLGSDGVTQYQNQTDGNTNNPDVTLTGWIQVISNPYPVGAPIPWPLAIPPAGFLMMTGQSFSAATYPKLALAYPALVIPDMRAEFIRGWDGGRGVDTERALGSAQASTGLRTAAIDYYGADFAISDSIVGTAFNQPDSITKTQPGDARTPDNGVLSRELDDNSNHATQRQTGIPSGSVWITTRPRNVAFNYIVRAA